MTTTATIGQLLVFAGEKLLSYAAALEQAEKGSAAQQVAARAALRTGLADEVLPRLLKAETYATDAPAADRLVAAATQPTSTVIERALQAQTLKAVPVVAPTVKPVPTGMKYRQLRDYCLANGLSDAGVESVLRQRVMDHIAGKVPAVPATPLKAPLAAPSVAVAAIATVKPIPVPSVAQVAKPAACPVPTKAGTQCKGKVTETGKCSTHSKATPAPAPAAPKTVTLTVDADKAEALGKLALLSAQELTALLELAAK
jgi:hypothetical protein